MAEQRHLANAPIKEALIDFRVKLPSTFDVKSFTRLEDRLKSLYPKVEEIRQVTVGVEIAGKEFKQTVQETGRAGVFFSSSDGKNVAQFRADGFTFNRLSPYTQWNTVFAEAINLWKLYVETSKPDLITRVALRFINQISIPLPIADFKDYLTAPPTVPATLPQAIRQFLTRIVVCDEEQLVFANITQALQKEKTPGNVVILFDIDVYKQDENGLDQGALEPTFERLHDLKNRIFFESITERTVRLFEQ
ncbi:MAG: TIGR04255 family protein [Chloroflexi bacterium]|nr:TIGR04255 family protein [Chloroflexota bacterium]